MSDTSEQIQDVSHENAGLPKEPASAGGGSNLSRVRAHNERLVLSLIREEPLPRAEIARRTGLSAQTITLITRALDSEGLIEAGTPVRGKVGQPSVPLMLKADGAYFMGLKVGRRSAELITMNFLGDVVLRCQEPYPYPTPECIVQFLQRELPLVATELGRKATRLHGLGVAMPYEIWDWSEKLGAPKRVMEQWRDFDFQKAISSFTELPVFVENDATAACGAELTFGHGKHHSEFAYFFIGYFIGGGLVINDSVYRGRTGNAGAFGSLPVIDENSKNGLSQLIDTSSIHLFESEVLSGTDSATDYLVHDSKIWLSETETLDAWISKLTGSLAMAIVSINSVVDVGVIIIDGGFPEAIRGRIVNNTRATLESLDTKGIQIPDVIEGKVGADARALGAARLPLFARFLLDETVLTKTIS